MTITQPKSSSRRAIPATLSAWLPKRKSVGTDGQIRFLRKRVPDLIPKRPSIRTRWYSGRPTPYLDLMTRITGAF